MEIFVCVCHVSLASIRKHLKCEFIQTLLSLIVGTCIHPIIIIVQLSVHLYSSRWLVECHIMFYEHVNC